MANRYALPVAVKRDMELYRLTGSGVAPSYVKWHSKMARRDIENQPFVVLEDHGLVDEGWYDGMRVVELVVAVKDEKGWHTATVRWHDSFAWFTKGAGWSRTFEMSEKTAEIVEN